MYRDNLLRRLARGNRRRRYKRGVNLVGAPATTAYEMFVWFDDAPSRSGISAIFLRGVHARVTRLHVATT